MMTNDAQPHLIDGGQVPGGYRSYCPICGAPVQTWRYDAEADADDCITASGEPGSTAAEAPSPVGQMVTFAPCKHAWHSAVHVSVDLIVRLPDDDRGAMFGLALPPETVEGGKLVVEHQPGAAGDGGDTAAI